MDRVPITVVEVEPFPAKAAEVWNDVESPEFIGFIAHNPESGDIMAGSGGVRKVRWSRSGIGKRGGVRAIYYFHDESMPFFLLTVYPKNQQDNLSPAEFKARKQTVSILKSTYGKTISPGREGQLSWVRDRRGPSERRGLRQRRP